MIKTSDFFGWKPKEIMASSTNRENRITMYAELDFRSGKLTYVVENRAQEEIYRGEFLENAVKIYNKATENKGAVPEGGGTVWD